MPLTNFIPFHFSYNFTSSHYVILVDLVVFYYINKQFCSHDGSVLEDSRSVAYCNIKSSTTMYLDQIEVQNVVKANELSME